MRVGGNQCCSCHMMIFFHFESAGSSSLTLFNRDQAYLIWYFSTGILSLRSHSEFQSFSSGSCFVWFQLSRFNLVLWVDSVGIHGHLVLNTAQPQAFWWGMRLMRFVASHRYGIIHLLWCCRWQFNPRERPKRQLFAEATSSICKCQYFLFLKTIIPSDGYSRIQQQISLLKIWLVRIFPMVWLPNLQRIRNPKVSRS
jgi:hypothetical protein